MRLDLTITLGEVLTALTLLTSFIVAIVRLSSRLAALEVKVEMLFRAFTEGQARGRGV